MHDLQLTTMVTICKACEGSSIDRNLLSTLAEKVSLNALKATEQIYIAMSLLYSGGKVLLKMHDDAGEAKLSLVIAQFVWHPIEACLWGLTRRRINRFKYGRFSIFHQGFSSEMSFTANYAHGRVQSQSINFKPQQQQHWNNRLKPLL